jgi:hypothetical protein
MVSEDFDHKDPQFPKSLGLPGVEAILQAVFRLAPADFVPIHTLKVAGHQFATPAKCSHPKWAAQQTTAGAAIERSPVTQPRRKQATSNVRVTRQES